jgi:hypothetical protein
LDGKLAALVSCLGQAYCLADQTAKDRLFARLAKAMAGDEHGIAFASDWSAGFTKDSIGETHERFGNFIGRHRFCR